VSGLESGEGEIHGGMREARAKESAGGGMEEEMMIVGGGEEGKKSRRCSQMMCVCWYAWGGAIGVVRVKSTNTRRRPCWEEGGRGGGNEVGNSVRGSVSPKGSRRE